MTDETKLHLDNEDDTASIFDDLDKLKADSAVLVQPSKGGKLVRRTTIYEKFARIPYGRARELYRHIGGPAWMVLIELDRLVLKGRGHNPVKLTTDALEGSGLTRSQKWRGLRLLEQAAIITVERKRGRCPLVTHLWYPALP